VKAEARDGGGAVFSVWLPRAPESAPVSAPACPSATVAAK
jgi:hypothetical protein